MITRGTFDSDDKQIRIQSIIGTQKLKQVTFRTDTGSYEVVATLPESSESGVYKDALGHSTNTQVN